MQLKLDGVDLFYTTHGKGRPFMLMHGGLGADHSYFRLMLDELGDTVELIYYDHRGNGRSRPAALDNVTHDTWAADADALRAHLGHDKIILFGHSYGGFLGQEYAVRYGDHLAGLILCCTSPAMDYGETIIANAQARAKSPEVLGFVNEALSPEPVATDADFGRIMDGIAPLYFNKWEAHAQTAKKMFENVQYSAAAWNRVSQYCMPNFNVLPRLGEIKVPTLVISGADDWITPPEQGERIHKAIPGSELVIFQNSGHYPYVEEHDQFISTVKNWIARLPE